MLLNPWLRYHSKIVESRLWSATLVTSILLTSQSRLPLYFALPAAAARGKGLTIGYRGGESKNSEHTLKTFIHVHICHGPWATPAPIVNQTTVSPMPIANPPLSKQGLSHPISLFFSTSFYFSTSLYLSMVVVGVRDRGSRVLGDQKVEEEELWSKRKNLG